MKCSSFLPVLILLLSNGLYAQVGISNDNNPPDNSAMLDVRSTSKGTLLPRMTTSEILAIQNPANGLQVFCTTDSKMYIFVDSPGAWREVAYGTGALTSPLTDARDGKTYTTVLIGTQIWMAQNLNIGTKINGTSEQTANGIIEKYCYNNSEASCDVYGGLYQWAEMVQYLNGAGNTVSWNPVPVGNVVGICPAGWHVPSYSELNVLITYLGGESAAGGKMKETGFSHWASPNSGANNSSGFTMLPGGDRVNDGSFENLTTYGDIRCATESTPTYAIYRYLIYNSGNIYPGDYYKTFGFSVRCIKD